MCRREIPPLLSLASFITNFVTWETIGQNLEENLAKISSQNRFYFHFRALVRPAVRPRGEAQICCAEELFCAAKDDRILGRI